MTIRTPLEWVTHLYQGVAPISGWVEFRSFKPGGGSPKREWQPWFCFEEHLDAFKADQIPAKLNVFFGVALRLVKEKAGNDGVHPSHLVWIDLDMKHTAYIPEGDDVLQMTAEELRACAARLYADLLTRCEALGLPPRAVVYTGHGLQVYWARRARSTLEDMKAHNLALVAAFGPEMGTDKTTVNAERVLRLPGSLNVKNPARPLPVEIWLADADAWVEREALQALAPKPKPAQVLPPKTTPAPVPTSGTGSKAEQRRRAEVEAALRGEEDRVRNAPDGTRNDTLNIAACKLARFLPHGELEEERLIEVLAGAARAVGLDEAEIMPTIRSGIGKGTQNPADSDRFEAQEAAKAAAKPKKVKLGGNLQPAAARIEGPAVGLTADQIPDPEGEGGSYSAEQIKSLLGLDFPTLSADSDLAHAYRLQAVAGGDLAYVPELGGYTAFNGKQWLLSSSKDGNEQAKPYAQRLGLAMRPEGAQLLTMYGVLAVAAVEAEARGGRESKEASSARQKAEAMEKAYFKHQRAAEGTEKDARQKAFLNQAHPLFHKPISDFEPRPWLVGFPNGVWDRGEFRPARREDHLARLAAVEYRPEASQSDWLTVLDRITGGDTDLQQTLQDVAGYAVSGASSLRLLPWLYGEGGTGKGTYSEMLLTVLGDLAQNIKPGYLATDGDRERLGAAIWGKRVALCAEAGNARLDAEALKTLSGGDRLTVRMLFAETFTTRPTHVLVMVANDAPKVEAYDDALKDRVLALPFKHPLKQGGPLLGGRRLEELRQDPTSALVLGFTAWLVEGLERVYKHGDIYRAAICTQATQGFWQEVDPLRDFWLCCDPSTLAMAGVLVSEFKAAYEQWAKDNGTRPLSAQKFNKAAKSVGLVQTAQDNKRVWQLEKPALFPSAPKATQGAEQGSNTRNTENTPISQSLKLSLPHEEEKVNLSGNTLKPVISVIECASGWEGEEL